MATGHSVIPIDDRLTELTDYLEEEMVFVPADVPRGRFPTLAELRRAIHELGYQLEETYDWYVTSEEDHLEIWFKGENREEDRPIEFWFRRGDLITFDILQALANVCGSFLQFSHSGSPTVLIVPDSVVPNSAQESNQRTFLATISYRIPLMLEQLTDASLETVLFILSQIRQALGRTDYLHHYEFYGIAQKGLPQYRQLLNHEDYRVRYLAFGLVATFRQEFYFSAEALKSAISNESDIRTKTFMVGAIAPHIVREYIHWETGQDIQQMLDLLHKLNSNLDEAPSVRLAATNLLALAQPGLITETMRVVFIDALVRPEHYMLRGKLVSVIIDPTLKSIQKLPLHHRIAILQEALPKIFFADDAHTVMRDLLDHVFFGAVRPTVMSSLPENKMAERTEVDEARFREHESRNWLYAANPTKLTSSELLPFQRETLEMVIALDVPWMVHSNLLEKYGLPVTREAVRAFLATAK